MAQISKITLPSGTVYDIKDAQARADIAGLQIAASGGMHYLGATTTPLTDGATNSTISVGGQTVTPIAGDIVIYDDKEFILSGTSPAHWNEFGSTGSLKALAFKDNASSTYKPAGTVSKPTFTGTQSIVRGGVVSVTQGDPGPNWGQNQDHIYFTPSGTIEHGSDIEEQLQIPYTPAGTIALTTSNKNTTVTTASGTATYTPAGTVSQPSFTGTAATVSVSGSPSGSVTISTGTGSSNYKPAGTVSQPSFTGTAATVSVSGSPNGSVTISTGTGTSNYKPAGTVSQPSFTGTSASLSVVGTPSGSVTISTASGISNYTPRGEISAPTVSVSVNTATVNSITAVGTLPDLSMTVANENLTIAWDEGTLPTKGSNQTVATGIKSATATQPTFTGAGVRLTASFSGSATTSTGSYTPGGTVSQPTFTGTATQLKGSFSGSATTFTGAYTPEGSVSQPSFTGTATQLKGSFSGSATTFTGVYTPGGSVSQPTFSGTGARLVTGNIAVPTSAAFTGTSVTLTTAVQMPQYYFSGDHFDMQLATTAAGSVSQPTFSGTQATITVS